MDARFAASERTSYPVTAVGTIYVVRHGQAAFGTDTYDRLTEVGFAQAQLLGRHFAARRVCFDAVFTGTLSRQVDTARAILDALPEFVCSRTIERLVGLNEYDPAAILKAHTGEMPHFSEAATRREPETVREHFRSLRDALIAWTDGDIQAEGTPAFVDFQRGAYDALIAARERHPKGTVLIVTSGGPIAAMLTATLRAPRAVTVDINLRVRNCSLTEYASTPKRHQLISFNGVSHLETEDSGRLVTYA